MLLLRGRQNSNVVNCDVGGRPPPRRSPAVTVRRRVPEDLPRCVEVLLEVHRTHAYPVNWPPDPAGWLSPPHLLDAWVAVVGPTVIGHVSLVGGEDSRVWLERLFVDPEAGGAGAGTSLLRECVASASGGHRQIALEVADNCRAAISMYERAGWQQVSREPITWGGRHATTLLRYEPALGS